MAEEERAVLCLLLYRTYLKTDRNHCTSRPINALKRLYCSRLDLLTCDHAGMLPTTGDFRQPLVCLTVSQIGTLSTSGLMWSVNTEHPSKYTYRSSDVHIRDSTHIGQWKLPTEIHSRPPPQPRPTSKYGPSLRHFHENSWPQNRASWTFSALNYIQIWKNVENRKKNSFTPLIKSTHLFFSPFLLLNSHNTRKKTNVTLWIQSNTTFLVLLRLFIGDRFRSSRPPSGQLYNLCKVGLKMVNCDSNSIILILVLQTITWNVVLLQQVTMRLSPVHSQQQTFSIRALYIIHCWNFKQLRTYFVYILS